MTTMVNYDFNKIEQKWQKAWESKKIFEVKEDSKKKKFYVLDMFPYPSGTGLHMGHAFVFSLGDILARLKRLQGYNVLYPIGYDSLGLPAENAAIKAGTHPKIYTEKSITNFMKQQKAMGWSYDWSRMVRTSDPDFYKWDQWIFLKMLEKEIAYRKKASVNWCPKCETVLANEQVTNGKCWRHEDTSVEIKHLEQWFFRISDYADELLEGLDKVNWPENAKKLQKNWIGKSYGAEIKFEINGEKWPIFTTRPDTIFGVTFMVVSAQHPRLFELVTKDYKKDVEKFLGKIKSVSMKSMKEVEDLDKEGVFTGSYAINPLTNEKIPVYAGNFVLADYGSGMVMAVPAHDSRDFEFAKKYGIPIRQVISKQNTSVKSILWLKNVSDDELKKLGLKIIENVRTKNKQYDQIIRKVEFDKKLISQFEKFISQKLEPLYWNEYVGPTGIVYIFKHKDGKIERIELNPQTEEKISKLTTEFFYRKPVDKYLKKHSMWKDLVEGEDGFYQDLIIHTEKGILINSQKFNGLESDDAKEKIVKELELRKLGKKTVQYKLRDWLISRQRYWGTPIPVIYCDKCGIVPVPEKDLPVKLPDKVKFGEGNPLATNKDFVNVKCPKCNGKARRETDTMDTFVNSSWYYLRYTDSKNSKKLFDEKKVSYWCPIDQYIGGPEHITMHLIYVRFYAKFLRDLGLIKFNEPALKYFTQGIVHGSDGEKMSKSRGNVVEPLEMIEKYGADTLRLALVSFASPDSDTNWDEKIVHSGHKFLIRVFEYFSNVKFAKNDIRVESKINKAIREITIDIENFKHNLAVIKLKMLFDYFQDKQIDKKTAERFLILLSVYCPFICEELWMKIGGKGFVSLASWPEFDDKKIDENLEKQEQVFEKTVSDVLNILKIIKEKNDNEAKKVYLYVIPNELNNYNSEILTKRIGKEVRVFPVNDKGKYDPDNKSGKAKPGRPSIYVE
ncbi:MAG TPA: class I tRNA ligase family protein [Candidatus Nanoarchaeia archaeon]|nr:class I tRNA ligase family protein [Candidatus Nanoarchaeia archaeon]